MMAIARTPAAIGSAFGLLILALAAIPLMSGKAQNRAQAPVPVAAPATSSASGQTKLAADGRQIEGVEADVSTRSVAVTSSFTGTEIVIFGSVEHSRQPTAEAGYYDIAIVVVGTPTPVITRRKSNVAGIWLNSQSVMFENVPSYYTISSTRPIEELADPRILSENSIGFESVHMPMSPTQAQLPPNEVAEFKRAVIRLKQKENLYQKSDYGVAFIGRSLFRSTISLPANVPVGALTAHTYLFKEGKLMSKHVSRVTLQREGLERYLHDFAFNYPLFYGIFAVFIAVAAGLLASVLFKRGSH